MISKLSMLVMFVGIPISEFFFKHLLELCNLVPLTQK